MLREDASRFFGRRDRYFDVLLRFHELQWSEKKTPKKIILQSLRKSNRRPACLTYESGPCVYEIGSMPISRDFEYRAEMFEEPSSDGEYSEENSYYSRGFRHRRPTKKSSQSRKPDLRYCDIVDMDEESCPQPIPEIEEPEEVGASNVGGDSVENEFYHPPERVRAFRRAVRNNQHLTERIRALEEQMRSTASHYHYLRRRRAEDDEERVRSERRRADMQRGIDNLRSQYSDIDTGDSRYYGWYSYPPPVEPETRRRSNRPSRGTRASLPLVGQVCRSRVIYSVCPYCRIDVTLEGQCVNTECQYYGGFCRPR